ncbi:hypothetical protein L0F63_002855 [Massospora cicadina]|nr:hypothetical protein L0F63_002855 [Massospora cicadina]
MIFIWILGYAVAIKGGELFFTQRLDHSGCVGKNRTFKQRYFMNDTFYEKGGPGIIFIGGERDMSEYFVLNGLALDLAKEHHGVLYALEHRYYGKSQPFDELTVENLRFLSSHQAVDDLAYFAKNVDYPINKWLLIGGSYAGNLAAWARQRYPNLFYGALASSAPVEAKANFMEYDAMMGEALGPKCFSVVNQVMKYVDSLYMQGNLTHLKRQLNCTQVEDDLLFLYHVASTIDNLMKNSVPRESPNFYEFCAAIEGPPTLPLRITRLMDFLNSYYKYLDTTCYISADPKSIQTLVPTPTSFHRQWVYQLCTEFGYWLTASAYPIRSKFLTVDWYNNFYCRPPFFTPAIGPPNPLKINQEHQGKQINTTRILFTNGQLDPWSALSPTCPLDSHLKGCIVIPNATHVNDLFPQSEFDSVHLIKARPD